MFQSFSFPRLVLGQGLRDTPLGQQDMLVEISPLDGFYFPAERRELKSTKREELVWMLDMPGASQEMR